MRTLKVLIINSLAEQFHLKKYYHSVSLAIVAIFALCLADAHEANAETRFFTNEEDWRAEAGIVEVFSFTSANVAKANEVLSPPATEDDLGTTVLTFLRSSTGLAFDFKLTALNAGHTWNFEDRGLSDFLSPGDIDRVFDPTLPNLEDDDFDVEIFSGQPVTAFAFDLLGNDRQLVPVTESFSVFGAGGTLLGSTPLPVTGPFDGIFLGVITDSPITKLSITEDAEGSDNIGIQNFRFGRAVLDHFLLYRVSESDDSLEFEERDVWLADQFVEGNFEVEEVEVLGNPADKNGEGVVNPDAHLVGYEIEADEDEQRGQQNKLRVANQFGEVTVKTWWAPDQLLVPSAKGLSGPVLPLEEPGTDHFLCYRVWIPLGAPRFEPVQVMVADQFEEPTLFAVLRPKRFCNPVDKNQEGIINPDSHLICYTVIPTKFELRQHRRRSVYVNNQFGPLQLDTRRPRALCVPSSKEVLE